MAKIFPYLRTALQENKTSVSTGQRKGTGTHPDYFCHEIALVIFKDLDMHLAERHKLD